MLSNGIFASANENKEDACSIVRHVPLGAVNLAKISALNQLARDICDQKISLIDSWAVSYTHLGWMPSKTELDSYECRHGMGYSVFTGIKKMCIRDRW